MSIGDIRVSFFVIEHPQLQAIIITYILKTSQLLSYSFES
jgi:hypothetical protein